MKIVKIGTRGSKLALYQAEKVKEALENKFSEINFKIEIIQTKGDKILDVALSKIGDKGLFTKEIENSMLRGETSMAVHSLKDLPTVLPQNLCLGGVLARGEFRDALVSKNGKKLNELTEKDIIATSSLRRKAQLLSMNPGFNIVDIRGNVITRLKKMDEGHCDAMIMAAAGLQRIGLAERITEVLQPEEFIPAVSQGAIAIEIVENDTETARLVEAITHKPTLDAVLAERAFLNTLEGGCQIPIGCYTNINQNTFSITGFVADIDGTKKMIDTMSGQLSDAQQIAKQLAEKFIEQGAAKIIANIRDINKIG